MQQSDGRIVFDPEAARLPVRESSVDSISTGRIHVSVWGKGAELVIYRAQVVKSGTFTVSAVIQGGVSQPIIFDINGKSLVANPQAGSGYTAVELGEVALDHPGEISLVVRPQDIATWKGGSMAEITLTPKP
jgi:hypothetical protein